MRLMSLASVSIILSTVLIQLPNIVIDNDVVKFFLKGLSVLPFVFFIVIVF